jgi:hypothetical protein
MKHNSRKKLNKVLIIAGLILLIAIIGYGFYEFNKFFSDGMDQFIKFCCNQLGGEISNGNCIKNNLTVDFKDCKIPKLYG